MARDRPDQHDDPLRNQKREQLAHCDSPFLALWLSDQFAALNDKLDRLGRFVMASAQQLNEELIQINAATTAIAESNAEIVSDLDDLIASGQVSGEHLTALTAAREALQTQVASLKATASKHTPGSQP